MIEFVDTALKIAFTLINTCGLILALVVFSKWLVRMERRQELLQDTLDADINRYAVLYLELLTRIKNEFLQKGQVEDAMQFQKLINAECARLRGDKKDGEEAEI